MKSAFVSGGRVSPVAPRPLLRVSRCDLDDIAADDVDASEAMQNRLRLARSQASGLRCTGAGGKGRVEPVDIERDVGWTVPDDLRCPSGRRPRCAAQSSRIRTKI